MPRPPVKQAQRPKHPPKPPENIPKSEEIPQLHLSRAPFIR